MSETPNSDPAVGQLQTGPASSTTDWGKAPSVPEITRFLQGPQKRTFELGRAVGIFFEIMRGFRKLHFVGPCVTVFGSARFTAEYQYYMLAREVGDPMPEKVVKIKGLDEQLRTQDQVAQVMKSVRHLHGALDLGTTATPPHRTADSPT